MIFGGRAAGQRHRTGSRCRRTSLSCWPSPAIAITGLPWPRPACFLPATTAPAQRPGEPQLAQRQSFGRVDDLADTFRAGGRDVGGALRVALADDDLLRFELVHEHRGVGGDEELGAFAGLAEPLGEELQGVRVQAVVDLLDARHHRRVRVVEEGEQAEHAYGAEGGVGEAGPAAQVAFLELDGGPSAGAGDQLYVDVLDGGHQRGDVLQEGRPRVRLFPEFQEEVHEIGRVVGEQLTGQTHGRGPSGGTYVGVEDADFGEVLGEPSNRRGGGAVLGHGKFSP